MSHSAGPARSFGGCTIPLLLLAALFLGFHFLGLGGALGGLAVLSLAWSWLFLARAARGRSCAACGRSVIDRKSGSEFADRVGMPGVFMRTSDLCAGRGAPGSLCSRCGRLYCGCSYPQSACICGSRELRTIAVEYSD
jgi:hypothetical protein